ncbi:MAG: endonuclease III [Candidatus Izemoplasmatales bacterium]|nr:endonuclease III [Candidatus Izemoplasmatales bacterium]
MTKKQVDALKVYDEITKLFPNAGCELNYRKDYELLIAIMLSAQTTDQSVNKVTEKLFQKYQSLIEFSEAPVGELERDIKHLGLFRNKAKNLHLMTNKILQEFSGVIPKTQEDLESLPGVGRKTANVYLAEMHHIPRIAVDTHVSRVSIRLGFAKKNSNPIEVEKKLMKLYPQDMWISLHHKLIFFGRYFCTARKPNCKECPIIKYCKMPEL